MSTSPREQKSKTTASKSSVPLLLLATALDTTWRAFLPTIGGTFLGIGIDHWLGIAPWATIVCLFAGTALAALLITLQIRRVRSLQ